MMHEHEYPGIEKITWFAGAWIDKYFSEIYLFLFLDMNEQSSKSNFHLNFVQHNIRELLDSNLPTQITQLEESTVSLERVAAYCEANYIQVHHIIY